jgi:hypothetical protein
MMRLSICTMLISLSAAAAPATRPAASETQATLSTRPVIDLDALHMQAFEAMQRKDWKKAEEALDQVWKKTPANSRTRALMINHAIIDIMQRRFVMRAVKDLAEYLVAHRDSDEQASNLLAGAMNVAARDPKLKKGDLWQSAYREWERRNFLMDHGRRGFRRWGTRWITDADYAEIKQKQDGLAVAVEDAYAQAERARRNAESVMLQYYNAQETQWRYSYLRWYVSGANTNNIPQAAYGTGANYLNPNDPRFLATMPGAFMIESIQAAEEAARLAPQVAIAVREMNTLVREYLELRVKVIRPDWPTEFDPVDPRSAEASKPPPLPPADPNAKAQEPKVGMQPLPPPRKSLYK